MNYLDYLHRQNFEYPAELVQVLCEIFSEHRSHSWSVGHGTVSFQLSSNKVVDGAIPAFCAHNLKNDPGPITITDISDDVSIIKRNSSSKSTARRIVSEIIHENRHDPLGVMPFNRWNAKQVTQEIECKPKKISSIKSIIAFFSSGHDEDTGTPAGIVSFKNPAYNSIFSHAGVVERVRENDSGENIFVWSIFGVLLHLTWPRSADNLSAVSKLPSNEHHNPCLKWCLQNLSDLHVGFPCLLSIACLLTVEPLNCMLLTSSFPSLVLLKNRMRRLGSW